eukprot:4705375-Pleurochrysis_carterae.AAC.1
MPARAPHCASAPPYRVDLLLDLETLQIVKLQRRDQKRSEGKGRSRIAGLRQDSSQTAGMRQERSARTSG